MGEAFWILDVDTVISLISTQTVVTMLVLIQMNHNHQVAPPHTDYATADAKSPNNASLQPAEYTPPTTAPPHAACKQSAQMCV